ncbi:MAG: 50S ribosomal protein L5 [Candidatus Wolfebacteria bacterium GW2011_GWC1_43_10]|uniref:Large ribosomal subunit protein uL5 n=2 Tax=Candidatus Wolfeibacteriota TaxID=1752735 RepID=A0A0G1C7Z9_9BACT|nr:MAG: 50S ribosomal protein L5 [Candidatus Wolfebacteria bacterium GW2011_GWC1_43_10]KKT22968.1 MAG: 50S ribosomal protein L5 [Parcubacteria group bacterium GW2011_GWB1_43_8b]OGM89920.1 MAG: 50S ribosomal protein L5 [Candidatus Wolfebacteria bacterium GWA1_42_9]
MTHQTLQERYQKKIRPELEKELGIKNIHIIPQMEKVVVNAGIGKAGQRPNFTDKILPEIIKEFSVICGQKPSLQKAKKSISGFKVREGQVVGLRATLRGRRMYDFTDRLIKTALPRVRDFRGISLKNIDEEGNLNLGIKEQVIFPEIEQDVSNVDFGFQITFVTRARKREEALELYKKLGFVFKKN